MAFSLSKTTLSLLSKHRGGARTDDLYSLKKADLIKKKTDFFNQMNNLIQVEDLG